MLSDRPDLDQFRRQAKELRDAARAGEPAALARLAAIAPIVEPVQLAAAQLVIAREQGFPSWPAFKVAVDAKVADLAERTMLFLRASLRGPMRVAVTLLAEHPAIATYSVATALVLGDVDRVRTELARDPGFVDRRDAEYGWPPLLVVCNSRWHRDPRRGAGLAAIAELLLDAGADPNSRVGEPGVPRRCSTLFGAAGLAYNPTITRLLLDRGAVPDEDTAYHVGFDSGHECLRLVLPHLSPAAAGAALSATISTGDVEGTRLILAAGVDLDRPLSADLLGASTDEPIGVAAAAVEYANPDVVRTLVTAGADPDRPGRGGYTAYQLALRRGQLDLADWLAAHGATSTATDIDRMLAACLRADRAAADELLGARPDLTVPPADQGEALVHAAERGATAAVALMLDLGFDPTLRTGDEARTALHGAAAAGSTDVVRLLLARGADLHAHDDQFDSDPLDWAVVGSGLRLGENPDPDWVGTVQALIDAGADPTHLVLGDEKPPSAEVAALLATYGVTR